MKSSLALEGDRGIELIDTTVNVAPGESLQALWWILFNLLMIQ
jgi:hypothetical protein